MSLFPSKLSVKALLSDLKQDKDRWRHWIGKKIEPETDRMEWGTSMMLPLGTHPIPQSAFHQIQNQQNAAQAQFGSTLSQQYAQGLLGGIVPW